MDGSNVVYDHCMLECHRAHGILSHVYISCDVFILVSFILAFGPLKHKIYKYFHNQIK